MPTPPVTADEWRPRLRARVHVSPEEQAARPAGQAPTLLVIDPIMGRRMRFGPSVAGLLGALDGTHTVAALERRALDGGAPPGEAGRVLRQLLLLHFLEGAGEADVERYRRVRAGEEIVGMDLLAEGAFACLGSGDCCRSYAYGPLTKEDVARLDRLDIPAGLPEAGPGPWVVEREIGGDDEPGLFLRSVDERCVFLLEDGRCGIHKAFGPENKPNLCRIYPYIALGTIDGLKIWDNGECSNFSTTARKGLPVVRDLERIRALMPRSFELYHPPVSLDDDTAYDFSYHLAYERAACRLAGELAVGPIGSVVAAARLQRALVEALERCPLEAGEPAGAAARALATSREKLLAPPEGDPRRGLTAIAGTARALFARVSGQIRATTVTPHGVLSAAQYRELGLALHMIEVVALDRAAALEAAKGGPAPAPLLPAYARAVAIPADGPELAAVYKLSLRQQLFGAQALVDGSPRAGALRLVMTVLATFFGARLHADLREAPRVEAADFDAGHKLARRIFRNPAITPIFVEREAAAWESVEALPHLGAGL